MGIPLGLIPRLMTKGGSAWRKVKIEGSRAKFPSGVFRRCNLGNEKGARYFNYRSDQLVHQTPTQRHTFSRSEGIQCPTTDSSRNCIIGAEPGMAVSGHPPLFTG